MTTSRALAIALFLILAAWTPGDTNAAPINFVEGVVELDNNPNTPTGLGALDVGVNTVHGTVACQGQGTGCHFSDDRDAFEVTLSSSLKITSVTLSVTNFQGENFSGNARDFLLILFGTTPFTADGLVSLFSGNASGPGSFVFDTFGSAIDPQVDVVGSFSYTWSLTVARAEQVPVPVPATLLLLASAVMGMGALRRWTRR